MAEPFDRRRFLGQSVAAGAAFSVLSNGQARAASATEKVIVGVMGLSRGRALAVSFARQPNVEVKYVCDVDENRAAAAAKSVGEVAEKTPQTTGDFRRILDDNDVHALVCAAPNHWHGPATILACSAGKHVYVEKPCSHNPREGELMIEAARKHRRAVQVGTQRRSGTLFQNAMQALHEGIIGRVYCARAYYNSARGPIGHGKPAQVPSNLNYELWQGPAPRTPYLSNRVHYNWHWFWHWGNGELGNNGVHTLDLCRWGMQVDYPTSVTSSGGRYRFEDDQETPDTHAVACEFADRKSITWQGLSCNRHRSGFVTFYGETGALELTDRDWVVYDDTDKEVKREGGSRGDQEHIAQFLTAIREETPLILNAEIEKGHKSTLLCHLGNIAQRTGRVLNCDPQNGHIQEDKDAMALWQRDYADGWEPQV